MFEGSYNLNNIKKIDEEIEDLKKIQSNHNKEMSENQKISLELFIHLLINQKETMLKHIKSIDKVERKRLNAEILKNENSIYNRFYPMFLKYYSNQYSQAHLFWSLTYDFFDCAKNIKKNAGLFTTLFSVILIIIGVIIYNVYLTANGFEISINFINLKEHLLSLGIVSLFFITYFVLLNMMVPIFVLDIIVANKKPHKYILLGRVFAILILFILFNYLIVGFFSIIHLVFKK
ncbi:hypothetical protein CPIN18021_1463 [Campylobacter pinnipediorum subsp. caledonicus]|uniref:Uncharacterized protein n=1 Tax=Campylobacter pinnipediorum subsp. caledonicus TaxID=1874362 RepID=A0A1S6U958_9BACT|nr:hypothetical protein [Campylobacter pinnipediorum]AQW86598.1 hypothetical protein CPIN18020_1414 [Campylobacter pinnipediorum subsp. caledonicus]AQW88249.1 hypothetical protein CPIN18021_1463 [Campylobacter pinnipediorum subsp. caledonicus]OPA70612.1 hypothetical protein BB381_04450 [Campylobacter pinnipediorum subsp. caledonicus]